MKKTPSKKTKVKLPGILYSVRFYTREMASSDVKSIVNKCRQLEKKYPHVGWFVSDSTTDGKLARKETIKTHKRGRPKQVVHGRSVKRHVHLGAVGDGKKSAYSFAKEISMAFNKRYSKNLYRPIKVTTVRSMRKYNYNGEIKTNGANYVFYSYRQANAFYSGGKFNFKPFFSPTYYECVETSEEERNRLLERRRKRREKKAEAYNNRHIIDF